MEEDSGSRASMLMVRQFSESVALETCWIIDILAELERRGRGRGEGRGKVGVSVRVRVRLSSGGGLQVEIRE